MTDDRIEVMPEASGLLWERGVELVGNLKGAFEKPVQEGHGLADS